MVGDNRSKPMGATYGMHSVPLPTLSVYLDGANEGGFERADAGVLCEMQLLCESREFQHAAKDVHVLR